VNFERSLDDSTRQSSCVLGQNDPKSDAPMKTFDFSDIEIFEKEINEIFTV
jgi:hypothetical protein